MSTVKIETKTLEARSHLVVPVVMGVVGVWPGSAGPLYYPAEELGKTPATWNGRPVVVNHPNLYGRSFAGDPEVFNKWKIGVLMNTEFDGKRLTAEAWLDKERLSAVDERVQNAVDQRQMVEVSTGLYLDVEEVRGEFNGTPYIGIARNFRPDHLAILPDQTGACSIADGAGLCRNTLHDLGALLAPLTV